MVATLCITSSSATLLLTLLAIQSAAQPAELNSIQSPAHEEDDDNSLLQVSHNKEKLQVGKLNPIPPIGVVKVHKCGSSTSQKIAQSLAVTRNLSIMFPIESEEPYLGWPSQFPGKKNLHKIGPPHHQYHSINHHAVFNDTRYKAYLKPDPVFVAGLREPVGHIISTYSVQLDHAYNVESWHNDDRHDAWELLLNWLEKLPMEVDPSSKDQARYRNPMAWNMGWYEHTGFTAEHDDNRSMIDEWISTLDADFNQMGSIIIQEYFDEGLVLLKKRLNVDIKEVSYIYFNEGGSEVAPTPMQRHRLKKLNPVDEALFEHFNTSFTELWLRDEQENKELLAQLKQANTEYETFCLLQKAVKGQESGFCALWSASCGYANPTPNPTPNPVMQAGGVCPFLDAHYDDAVKEVGGCMPPSCRGLDVL